MERKRAELRARGVDPDRLPPGQYVTDRFPVLHLGPVPDVDDVSAWRLDIGGDGVDHPRRLTWEEVLALPATVAYSARKAIEIVEREPQRVARLHANVARIRAGLTKLGFQLHDSPTAIIPIMIGDEADAIATSRRLMELGVMVIGFGFPVVPKGQARLRVQVSAALTDEHIDRALAAFSRL